MLTRPMLIQLALNAQLDPRTVKNAIEHGLESMKSEFARVRLREAAKKMKIEIE